jgi:catechol 2,3-dioxygenase-like lactoylglutathione lyase family enzyme
VTDRWGRTVLLVRDYDEALAFYLNGLGLEVTSDTVGEGGFRLLHIGTGGTGSLWLMKAFERDLHLVGNQAGGHPFGVFYVDDLDLTLVRLAGIGTRPLEGPHGDDQSRWAHVADLYGNVIVLVQLAGRPEHSN